MKIKIFEGTNKNGDLVYFEVANSLLSRKTAIKIIKEIPDIEILNENLKDDIFFTFKIGKRIFEIWEPYGDNSRFHISEKKAQKSIELQIIERKFSTYKPGIFEILNR